MAKRLSSVYRPGAAHDDWVKVRSWNRQEFVVGGWEHGEGGRSGGIGSLLLGVYEGPGLSTPARSAPGSPRRALREHGETAATVRGGTSPFVAMPPDVRGRPITWVRPEVVVEVEFAEWTVDGRLRFASFQGVRTDKRPRRSSVSGSTVAVEVDGRDAASVQFGQGAVPGGRAHQGRDHHLLHGGGAVAAAAPRGRALTRKRYPNGVDGPFFFEKNAPRGTPDWVRTGAAAGARAARRTATRSTTSSSRSWPPWSGWPTWPRWSCTLHSGRSARAAACTARTSWCSTSTRAPRPRSASAARSRCCCGRRWRPTVSTPVAEDQRQQGPAGVRGDRRAPSDTVERVRARAGQGLESEHPKLVVRG